MEKGLQKFLSIVAFILSIIILLSLPVMLLWNWLMPDLFGLPTIGFWQALGLNILATILFKSNQIR